MKLCVCVCVSVCTMILHIALVGKALGSEFAICIFVSDCDAQVHFIKGQMLEGPLHLLQTVS